MKKLTVGVGALDDPTAKRQFGTVFEKCCAFSGGTSWAPSPYRNRISFVVVGMPSSQ